MVVESPFPGDGAATMRCSNHTSTRTDDEESSGPLTRRHAARNASADTDTGDRTDDGESESVAERVEDDEDASDPIQFPQSTYSLLFTEPILSLPFAFAFSIHALSITCLLLALYSGGGLESGSIPVKVDLPVRIAQYLSVIVVLLMEEEIPTAIYLLRMIPEQSLHEKYPQISYKRFELSSQFRFSIGSYFLVCAMFVITHASGVIEIFYDILALQFVQQLDDIAFDLAKKDVMGKKLKRACTAKYFLAEFDKERRGKDKRRSFCLKASYLVNLCWMLAWLVSVSVKQIRGDYFQSASSITVNFGDTVWEKSWTKVPSWRPRKHPDESFEEWTLVYAYFNGVYEMVEGEGSTVNHRPVYRERRKDDPKSPFETTIPAEIKYCAEIRAWVFTHDDIFKSKPGRKAKNHGCNWLLRSPETEEFNLLDVIGDWEVWVGVIGKAELSIASNECQNESDCNLNGQCIEKRCECDSDKDVQYIGAQCEVILRDSCQTIIGESYNETFSVLKDDDRLFPQYSRPVFVYNGGHPDIKDEGLLLYVYSGNRWFGTGFSAEEITMGTEETRLSWWSDYHAFWYQLYSDRTFVVSDPTSGSTPVGTDFYLIGERGDQFGPFGALYPLQLGGQKGRGYFRCNDTDSNPENAPAPARKLEFRSGSGRKGV